MTLRNWVIGSRRFDGTNCLRNGCNRLTSDTASCSQRTETLNITYMGIHRTSSRLEIHYHGTGIPRQPWGHSSRRPICVHRLHRDGLIRNLKNSVHTLPPYSTNCSQASQIISYLQTNSVFTYPLRPKRPAHITLFQIKVFVVLAEEYKL